LQREEQMATGVRVDGAKGVHLVWMELFECSEGSRKKETHDG
jgi:hypothetical protein